MVPAFLRFAAADCEPAVRFTNPAHRSIAASPAAAAAVADDLMLMDCDVPQFPQPVNAPQQPQLPFPPPTGEPRESRGFQSLQSSLSTPPGKLAEPLPFLPLGKSQLELFLSFSPLICLVVATVSPSLRFRLVLLSRFHSKSALFFSF